MQLFFQILLFSRNLCLSSRSEQPYAMQYYMEMPLKYNIVTLKTRTKIKKTKHHQSKQPTNEPNTPKQKQTKTKQTSRMGPNNFSLLNDKKDTLQNEKSKSVGRSMRRPPARVVSQTSLKQSKLPEGASGEFWVTLKVYIPQLLSKHLSQCVTSPTIVYLFSHLQVPLPVLPPATAASVPQSRECYEGWR